jgi:predicted metal-binding protein
LEKSQKEIDLKVLCDVAIEKGATRAKAIEARLIVVDERVQLKCRYPPCFSYGKNLMCPPYTPSAKEFRGYVAKYKHAIIVQRDVPIGEEIRKHIEGEGAELVELVKDKEFFERAEKESAGEWKKLHAIVSAVERESFNKGYYLSLGLVAGSCRLCDTCDPKSPCKKPWEARPSVAAVGIDIHQTAKNAGLELKWGTKETMTLTGLILI